MSEKEKEYEYVGVNVPPLLKKVVDFHVNESQASMGEYVREAIREKLERDYGVNASNLDELRELANRMEKKNPSTLKDCRWGDLTESEKKALDFLLEEGYDNLERGGNGEPDFYNEREEFEVKKPESAGKLHFTASQVSRFEKTDPFIIIVCDDKRVRNLKKYGKMSECPECGKQFESRGALASHLPKVHDVEYLGVRGRETEDKVVDMVRYSQLSRFEGDPYIRCWEPSE